MEAIDNPTVNRNCCVLLLFFGDWCMAQRPFGTAGTIKKLQTLADYLHFYTTALTGKFRLTYVDAFAGSGEIPMRESLPLVDEAAEISEVTEGSARRALRVLPPFDRYVFIDAKRRNVSSLQSLRDEFPELAGRIFAERGDANEAIKAYCDNHKNADRAVIFLDPFGNQVRWETIEAIAGTVGIDLWYLFPAGLGVQRQISKDGTPHPDAEKSLDAMFGTPEWRNHLVEQHDDQMNLFSGPPEPGRRVESADAVTRYLIERMKGPFDGRVLPTWLPLGQGRRHWYSLILAWSNPNDKATQLVRRVGTDIMRRR